ncbi:CRISPR-associated endonuclease Cas1 [Bullifex sp.]|uniref:CRISPR-associated endonuclease Cas1 n=1 Tax=Bullifex sp. TaxID=2815808 RepID=UPI002A834A96|nr:CRISPR-associated endonuclease Cas1 [Bullifex sp.]MDY4066758.1 CRISPR-associated endonuclease Cas1 [Bullifex sp.]
MPPKNLVFYSEELLLCGELDAIKQRDGEWIPFEARKSSAPSRTQPQQWHGYVLTPGAWYNDQLQVIGQMYLLRENSYLCSKASIYYRENKTHTIIKWNEECIKILETICKEINRISLEERPLPLKRSNKCIRCSLNTICLPDEVSIMKSHKQEGYARAVVPSRYDKGLVYVSGYDKKISIKEDCLVISSLSGDKQEIPIIDVMSVVILGTAQISTQCIQAIMVNGIKILFCSTSGWLYGTASGFSDKNLLIRKKQLNQFPNLDLAKRVVSAKIFNQRLLLRRKRGEVGNPVIEDLIRLSSQAMEIKDRNSLLGIEGVAAKKYFESFPDLITVSNIEFKGRSRRPPRDPINALLSYAYSLLCKDFVNAIIAVGLEPTVGFYHVFEKGRPSLALDLMESYRPLIADSTVLRAINTKTISLEDFEVTMAGVSLKPKAKKKFIMMYEQRMDTLIHHPSFSYQVSYRRMLEIEVRLLGRYLEGELNNWKPFRAR